MSRLASVRGATPLRLIVTAEELFAERGIDGVSLRDITSAAGANTASVHYHFGSKEHLLRAILEHRASDIGKRRDVHLCRIEASRRPALREVVEAMVLPTAELASSDEAGGRSYIGFLAALLERPEHVTIIDDVFGEQMDREMAALARVLPQLPREILVARYAFARDFINRALGHPDRGMRLWIAEHAPGVAEDLSPHLVDFLVGAFRAPVSN